MLRGLHKLSIRVVREQERWNQRLALLMFNWDSPIETSLVRGPSPADG